MKKISIFVLSLSLLALSSINNVASLQESTLDFNNESGITFIRNANNDETNEETIEVSNIYVQHGKIDGYDCLRFVTAIKGNVSSINYIREALDGSNENPKKVDTLYKSIIANGNNTYYDGTNLTTEESYAGDYYWACYTIKFVNDTYKNSDITVNINVDNKTQKATANLSKIIDEEKTKPYYYQAETVAELGVGSNKRKDNNYGYPTIDSRGFVGQLNSNKDASVKFNIEADDTNNADLYVALNKRNEDINFNDSFTTYINGVETNFDVVINKFDALNWYEFNETKLGTITLNKGNNEIMFVVKSSKSNCFNFDYLKIETKSTLLNNPELVVQAEDIVDITKTTEPTNKSYTVINDTNKAQKKFDSTFSGAGYIGSISQGGNIDFYIYSDKEINNAKLVLTAASSLLNDTEKKMDDLQLNKCFDISIEDNKIDIADDVVIKGLSYPTSSIEGSKWTRWADVNLGSINIKKGFTKVSILCTGAVKDCKNDDRTPNIDRLSIIL